MAVVLVFLNLSTSLVVVLFLLLLTLHPSQPDSVSRPTDPPSPDGRHQQNNSPPHLTVRQRVLDRLLLHENKPPGRQRQKRQAFDFGMNTPAPKPTTTTEGDTASTVNSSESSPGGGGSGGLVDPAHESTFQSADTAGTAPSTTTTTTTPCFGFNMCFLGFQCENGGTCVYNATTCLVSCSCPPPYNDPQFYDQLTCRSLGTLPPSVNSTTGPTAASSSDGAVTTKEPGCFGVNMCNHGFSCENGGTCFYNTTSCRVRCLCPPPYNDSQFYDQLSCGLLPTDPPPSSSSSPAPPPLPPTTLRPLSERQCRDATCIHGYCNATDFTRDPCRCDPGWKSFFCDVGCFKQCGNGGVCELFDYPLNKEKCVCLDTWIGENCTERKPEPQEHDQALVHWLSGSFAVGLVVLMILGAVFMFYLWRKRLVFALKIVYYFLPYEDNDGRQYDAFVSYVLEDADEKFVHFNLRPKLENEMGFNLCLHQRDFPVGGVISDNILDALENSRRFILILTPSYLKNEWAEFEFQRAFHEMLKRKLRIIPVILEDITSCPEDSLNPTLKTILESVVLFNYPGTTADDRKLHKFWKQLRLCMPKRKMRDDEENALKKSPVPEKGGGGDVRLAEDDAVHVTVV